MPIYMPAATSSKSPPGGSLARGRHASIVRTLFRPAARISGAPAAAAAASTARARRQTAPAAASATAAAAADAAAEPAAERYERLLRWASDETPRVAVRELPGSGRGLVATHDVPPGGVLLSVPLSRVFTSKPYGELEMHWAAEMGLRLLQERAKCRRRQEADASGTSGSSGSSSGSGGSSGSRWRAWIECLPARVLTPLEFTPAQARACGVPATVVEIDNMQATLRGCAEALADELAAAGCGYDDLLWAAQALHSRCFFDAGLGLHLSVPGVDMANDAGAAANARVRVVHSPDACQGAEALADIAPLAAAPGGSSGGSEGGGDGGSSGGAAGTIGASQFQLVAGDDGVSEGDEVCIAYGASWPAEPYFLLFGFVPGGANPYDSVVAYADLDDLCAHYCALLTQQQRSGQPAGEAGAEGEEQDGDALWQQRVAARASEAAAARGEAYDRLVVAADGLDGRLAPALQLVREAAAAEAAASGSGGGSGGAGEVDLGALVVDRLRQLRASLRAAEADAEKEAGGGDAGAWRLAAQYRAAKQRVVEAALAAMTAGGGSGGGGGGGGSG